MVLLARGSVTVTAVNDGVPEKLYRAWSNNANGSGYSTTDSSGKYLGTYVGLSEPTLASQYKWTLIKGETGEPGQPGVSAYLHTAWANSANGQTGFSTSVSTDKLYIGTYSSSSPTPSQAYTSYKWVRVKGLDAKFYSVIVDKSFLNRNGLSSTATEKIAINSYVYEGNSAGVAAPGFFIIKEQIKQTTAGATTYVFQEKHRSTTAVSQLNYTVSANAVTVKIEFYLTNQFNNLFAVRDIGVLMDASTDIEARVPIAQLIENINNHPSTTRISGAKLRFTNDVTFDKSFHTKLFAETGFIENLSTYEFSADNIKTGTLEADHIKGGTLDFDLFHAKHFSADSLTSGTIDADIININNLSASRIKTGNLDVSSGLKITSGNHQIMSIDPETLNLEFNVNQMSIGGVKLISEDDQPQMEQNIATELENKIKPYLHIAYANNATGTSGFSISDSLNKLYIGTYTNYTSTHSTDPSKYKWALIKGEKGTTGVGLQSITEWYLATPLKEGVTRTTTGWTNSVQTLSSVNNYLWNYEQVNYDNGTKHYTDPTIIGTFGEQGISVKGVTEYYLASPLSEGITKDTPGWTTDIQPLTPENKYLWNKETVHYSDDAAFLDKTEILSGTEIWTDKADEDAVVHVEIDGKSYQHLNPSARNMIPTKFEDWENGDYDLTTGEKSNTIGRIRVPWLVKVEPNATYYWNSNDSNALFVIRSLNSDGSFNRSWGSVNSTGSRTISSSEHYLGIALFNTNDYEEKFSDGTIKPLFQLASHSDKSFEEFVPPAPTPDYPIEIHSLNNFDVVSSVGKRNLARANSRINNTEEFVLSTWAGQQYSNIEVREMFKEGKQYTVSYDAEITNRTSVQTLFSGTVALYLYSPSGGGLQYFSVPGLNNVGDKNSSKTTFVCPPLKDDHVILAYTRRFTTNGTSPVGFDTVKFTNFRVVEGSEETRYSKSPVDITESDSHPSIDKINLLLDEPLKSVGDVKDRLFRDSDGLWKIERNIAQYISDGNDSWRLQNATHNRWDMTSGNLPISSIYDDNNNATTPVLNSHFIETKGAVAEGGTYVYGRNIRIYWEKPTSVDDLKSILKSYYDNGNPVTWHYQVRPYIENLSQSLQDKLNNLRTFKDSNYTYTVLPDKSNILPENLKPTLHATFKSKAWAGNSAGYPSIIGVYGDSAKLLYLSTSADSMTFNSDGSANPSSQTITFTGNLQNVLGNVIFTAIAYNGTTVVSTISLSGVGNTRTLTQAQFPASADRIQVKATLGNLEDTVTIVKLKNGADAIVGYLTNESVTLSANNAGTVSSFGSASGTFKVFEGTIDKTSSAASTFRVKTQTGAVGTINSSSGAYTISSMSSDTANIVFEATYKNIKIDQTLSLSKSKEGVKGIPGPQGVSITKVDVQYYLSTSNDSLVGGGWSTTAPAWIDGRFMWSKTVTTYTSGSPTESKPVCITGAKGSTGYTGRGVSSIVEQFYLSDSKTVEPPTSGWLTNPPTWSPGKYIWTRSLITYTTGTPATSTTKPIVSSEWEAINEIQIGGRNLFSASQYVSLRNSEGTSNGNRYSVGSSGALVVNGVDGSGGYDTMKMVDLKANTEYIFTFNIRISDRFSFYNTDGVDISVAKNWSGNNTQLTFKMGNVDGYIGGKFYPVEQEYPVDIYLMAEKGNKATDWTPAPEDVQKEIKDVLDVTNTLKNFTDTAFVDGVIERAEAQAIKEHLNTLKKENNDLLNQYSTLYTNVSLVDPAKSALLTARNNYATSYTSLVSVINTAISGDKTTAAQKTAVDNGFASYTNSLKAFTQKLSEAQTAIGAKVSSDAVDAIEIGGRNLVPNSKLIEHPIGRNNLLLISAGLSEGTYTISFDYEVDSIAVGLSSFLIYAGNSVTQVPLKQTGEKRTKKTFTITPALANIGVNIYFGNGAAQSRENAGHFIELQIEKGNVATDWSPAQEDITASIKVAQDKANAASQEAIAAQADATVGKNMADNLSNDSIITQVEKLELKREWDAIVKEKPSITIQATDYGLQSSTEATAYNTAYNSLNGSIPTLLSKMNETSPVNRTTFNTNFASYYDKRQLLLNRIAKKAKELADSAQSSVDNLEIGVRNLLRNSNFTDDFTYWLGSGTRELISDAVFGSVAKVTTTSNTGIIQKPTKELIVGKEYTLSTYVKAENSSQSVYLAIDGNGVGAAKVHTVSNGWTKISSVFTFSGVNLNTRIYTLGVLYVANVKLEEGNKATDWSPAPEDIEAAYIAVAQAKAEAERTKAESYADGIVSDEEEARIKDADAKLAAAKQHAENITKVQNIGDGNKKFINVGSLGATPSSISGYLVIKTPLTSAYMTRMKISGYNYLTNKTNIDLTVAFYAYSSNTFRNYSFISNGDYSYNKVQLARDSSGKTVAIIGNINDVYSYPKVSIDEVMVTYNSPPDSFKDGFSAEITQDISMYTNIVNVPGGDTKLNISAAQTAADNAATAASNAQGTANTARDSASTANNLLADIASDSVLTPGEKKNTKKEWDIIVGEKPKIDTSADTYSITTQKTAYNNAYNALNTYLTGSSGLLVNLNIKSAIVGTTFRTNFKNYYNARQDLLNAIADGAKSLIDEIEVGGRNLLRNSDFEKGTDFWQQSGANTIRIDEDGYSGNGLRIVSTTTTTVVPRQPYTGNFYSGDNLTVSVKVKTHSGDFSNMVGRFANAITMPFSYKKSLKDGWELYVFTIELQQDYSFSNTAFGFYLALGEFTIDEIKLEKGNKATDWTPTPEDVQYQIDKSTYNPVRYVRDWANGSTANNSNHWYEIQAIDTLGNNIALGKTVRSNASTSLFPVVTDGNAAGTFASGGTNVKAYMEVDLGSVYYNISEIKVWRYHNDGRTYYDTKTEVSEDGNNWYPIFDSKIEDEYAETSAGRTYPNTQAKSEGLLAAYHTTERLESATSKVVINGGNITAGRIQDSLKRNDLNLDNGTFKLANGNIEYDGTALKIKTGVQFAALPTDTQTKINAGAVAEANAKKYIDDNTGNLVNNPAATGNHTGWTGSGLSSLNQTFEGVSTRVLQTSTPDNVQYYSPYFKVDPSKAYEVSAWFKKSVANSSGYYFGLNGIDTSGSGVGFVHTTQTGAISNANNTNFYFISGTGPTDWVKVVGYIMPVGTNASDLNGVGTSTNAIMKQNIDRIRVRFLNWNNGGTTRQLWVANPKVVEVDPNAIITAAQAKTLTDTWVHPGTTQINGNNIRTGTLDAKIITTGTLSANNGTSTLNMSTGDMVMNGNFNLGAGALQWNKTSKTLSIKANSLKIGSYDAASKNDVSTSLQSAKDYTEQAVDKIEVGGRNLIVQQTITRGRYLNASNTPTADSSWFYTDYIPVSGYKKMVTSGYTNLGNAPSVVYYNSSKVFVRGVNNNGENRAKDITINSGEAFIRFSGEIRDLPTIKLEKGNKATDWTPAPEDVEAAYTAVAQTKAEAERVKAEVYADGKVTIEEAARIAEANAKLAEAKRYVDSLSARNFLLDSKPKTPISNNAYLTASFNLTEKPVVGEEYSFVIKGKLAPTKSNFMVFNSGGLVRVFGHPTVVGDFHIFKGLWSEYSNGVTADSTYVNIWANESSQTGTSTIEWATMVKGSVPLTEWVPTHEEIYKYVDDIEVGGDNLLRVGEWSNYSSYNSIPRVTNGGRTVTYVKNNNPATGVRNAALEYGPNIYYTISGYAKINGVPVTNATWGVNKLASTYQGEVTHFSIRDSDGYFVITQNWTSSTNWLFHGSSIINSSTGTITIDDFMVQRGTKATSWKLNPLDAQGGGRNYALGTQGELVLSGWAAQYNLSPDITDLNGLPATVSFWAKHHSGSSPVAMHVYYRTPAGNNLGYSYGSGQKTTTSYQKFVIPIDTAYIPSDLSGYNTLAVRKDDSTNSISIKGVKLEAGYGSTDWSPALEDVKSDVDSKADSKETAEQIEQARKDLIASQEKEVAELKAQIKTLDAQRASLETARQNDMTEVGQQFVSALSRVSGVETSLGEQSADWNFINTNIKMSDEGLMIGDAQKGNYLLQQSNRLDFISNGTVVAYVSNNELWIESGVFTDKLTIGGISVRKNGSDRIRFE